MFILETSPKESKVSCLAHVCKNEVTIELTGYIEAKQVMSYSLKNELVSVGYKIRMDYCRKFASVNGWRFKEDVDQYNVKTFTIRAPFCKKEYIPEITMQSMF